MRKVLTRARRHWRLRSATALAAAGAITVSLGVLMLGAATAQVNADEPCVPQDEWTETINHAAVTHAEQRMTDPGQPYIAPTEATEGHWEGLDWFVWRGGPSATAPDVDAEGWEDPPALPNGLPHEPTPETVYNVSEGDHGLGSWFKYDGTWVEGTPYDPGQPYIAPSYTTVTVTDKPAWTETIQHPAVVCEATELAPDVVFTDATCDTLGEESWDGTLEAFLDYETTGEVGPGETISVEAVIEPAYADEYAIAEGAETKFTHTFDDVTLEDCVRGEETVIPEPDESEPNPDKKPTVKGVEVVAPPAAVPTSVAAGVLGETAVSSGQVLGQAIAGLGLVLLLAAGWRAAALRTHGAHES